MPTNQRPRETDRERVARWITRDFEAVEHLTAEILKEEAWWTAARSGKYAHPANLRADDADGAADLLPGLSFPADVRGASHPEDA